MATETLHEALVDALAGEFRAQERTLALYLAAARSAEDPEIRRLKRDAGADRVRLVPGSATAALGLALGAALSGWRTVLTLDRREHLLQIINGLATRAAEAHARSDGSAHCPLLLRCQGSAADGLPAEALLAALPGTFIAAPSTPYDAKGLLRHALRAELAPTVLLEPDALRSVSGETQSADYALAFGAASMRQRGTDLTVVACGTLANTALLACQRAAEQGLNAELLDLRTLRPLDVKSVLESLRKTGRVLLCANTAPSAGAGGYASELLLAIHAHAFDELDAPIRAITPAEDGTPLTPERIAAAIVELAKE